MVIMRNLLVAVIVLVVCVACYMGLKTTTAKYQIESDLTPLSKWTVYGTNACGWTRKQLKEMDEKNVPYTYVDCDGGGTCAGISSFPTLKNSNGETKVGFTKF